MCRLLRVSVSGYYSWLNREPSLREKENVKLALKIKAVFDDEKSRPGAPRITKRLNAEGGNSWPPPCRKYYETTWLASTSCKKI